MDIIININLNYLINLLYIDIRIGNNIEILDIFLIFISEFIIFNIDLIRDKFINIEEDNPNIDIFKS
jgi:hypothetical protein